MRTCLNRPISRSDYNHTEAILRFTKCESLLTSLGTKWERFQRGSYSCVIEEWTCISSYQQKLISKGCQSAIEGYKYADTKELLSSSMSFLAAKIKRTMLETAVIENEFPSISSVPKK